MCLCGSIASLLYLKGVWAGAHMLARDDARSLIFFGGFSLGVWPSVDGPAQRRRRWRCWKHFAAVTSNAPFVAIAQRRNSLVPHEIGYGKPLAGVVLCAIV